MQLMVLKKKDTWEKQANKLSEEVLEVLEVLDAIQENNKEHVGEEVLDVIQVAIGMLDTLEDEGQNLKHMLCRHLKKLKKRGWKSKKLIIFQVFNWQ